MGRRPVPPRSGFGASMKALPKRKGNLQLAAGLFDASTASMKALPKWKGNSNAYNKEHIMTGLNESPSEKEGKSECRAPAQQRTRRLNESPSEKEGKSRACSGDSFGARSPQ